MVFPGGSPSGSAMFSCCCELIYLQNLTWRFLILSSTFIHKSSNLILAQQGCLAISASATVVKCWSCHTLLLHLTTASIFPLILLLLHSATPISSGHPAYTPAAHVQSSQELSSSHHVTLGWIVLHNPMQDFAALLVISLVNTSAFQSRPQFLSLSCLAFPCLIFLLPRLLP